jgi:hypothetical protein
LGSAKQVKEWKIKYPVSHAVNRQKEQMRHVIRTLGGKTPRAASSKELYSMLVKLVQKDRVTAKRKFPFGIPDAKNLKVELKIGFDRLHKSQFIWNILNGHDCKIRWFPSYDALERAIRGKLGVGKIFRSYRDFILWEYGKQRTCDVKHIKYATAELVESLGRATRPEDHPRDNT